MFDKFRRTVFLFVLFSGIFAMGSVPFFVAAAPDLKIETSRGWKKCRPMWTFFDAKDAPPTCISIAVKEAEKMHTAFRREYEQAMDEAMNDPGARAYIEMRERRLERGDDDSVEAPPLD